MRAADRPRATVLGAFIEGWRRALHAPGVTVAVWAVTTIVMLPLAALLLDSVNTPPGAAVTAERALERWEPDGTGGFASGARGLPSSFAGEVLGATGLLATLSRLVGGATPPPALLAAIAVHLAAWIFLSGGIIDRLARGRPLGAAAFIAMSGHYFFRLVRLAAVAGVAYWWLFRAVHPLLFGTLFEGLVRGSTAEPQAVVVLFGLNLVFALLLGIVTLIVDYTRVRLVVEDRRSVLSAIAAGLRFVRRRFWRAAGLYTIGVLTLAIVTELAIRTAASVSGPGWAALLMAQVWVVARIWSRMALLGAEAVFYQGELAHAHYTAAPLPRWPDSVSVEAIRNLRA